MASLTAHIREVATAAAGSYDAARALAAARIRAAGARMRRDALRRLDKSFQPLVLQVGDHVRVSLLFLPHVRRVLKSKLLGDPLPLFSTDVFRVEHVRPVDATHSRVTYDVSCVSCGDGDPLPAFVGGCLAQLPSAMRRVERRYLLRIPHGTRGTMGHAMPAALPRVWATV